MYQNAKKLLQYQISWHISFNDNTKKIFLGKLSYRRWCSDKVSFFGQGEIIRDSQGLAPSNDEQALYKRHGMHLWRGEKHSGGRGMAGGGMAGGGMAGHFPQWGKEARSSSDVPAGL